MPSFASSAFLVARDPSELDNVRTTLSSWDNCMSKPYCKWPVVAAIIIGSLIVLSLLFCLFRCLCCGLECCCGCLSCCNACCPSPRGGRRGKYEQAPQQPFYPQQQWQPQPQNPMSYGAVRSPGYNTATFDAPSSKGGRFNADALPAMPSWSNAESRRIEDNDYHGAGEEDIPLEHQVPATVSSPLDQQQRQPLTEKSSMAGGLAGGDLGRSAPHEYNNEYYKPHDELQSPVSPMQRATSPTASSIYSSRPPPSYHSTAVPPLATAAAQTHSNYAPRVQEQSYTPYSPQGYQPYNTTQHQLPQIHEVESGDLQSPSGRWGEQTGYERRPLPGSYRDV
ncbi:MAG: hypothetical protein M1828_002644 [Chrysothrix sp. TS-e1954]|nr:MAG: hypothetical protein M1828_002644 [Chrysothrix sp. TS-e1954]